MLTKTFQASESFADLFHAHYVRISRVIWRVVGNSGDAEEIAAEVFVRYCLRPPATQENVEGWLCRTALRLAFDRLRGNSRRRRYEGNSAAPGSPPDPHAAAEAEEERSRVRGVLAAIKPEQSALLLLRAEGYTYSELAKVQGISAASIGTYIARAEESFRKEYVKRHGQR